MTKKSQKTFKSRNIPALTAPYCLAIEKSVGALIYKEDAGGNRTYLVMQYPHGHWEFARGHMDPGETEEQTMYREIQEETEIAQDDLVLEPGFREVISFSYIAHGDERISRKKQKKCIAIKKKVVFYLTRYTGQEVVLSHEHTSFKWLSYEELLEQLTFENAKRVTRAAHKYLDKE